MVEEKQCIDHQPRPPTWQVRILPLNHQCILVSRAISTIFKTVARLIYSTSCFNLQSRVKEKISKMLRIKLCIKFQNITHHWLQLIHGDQKMVLISKVTFSSWLGLFFESKRTNFKYFIKISKGVVIGDYKWREMFHTHNTCILKYSQHTHTQVLTTHAYSSTLSLSAFINAYIRIFLFNMLDHITDGST